MGRLRTTAQVRVCDLLEQDVALYKGGWCYVYGINEDEADESSDLDIRDTVVRFAQDLDRRQGPDYYEDVVVVFRNPAELITIQVEVPEPCDS